MKHFEYNTNNDNIKPFSKRKSRKMYILPKSKNFQDKKPYKSIVTDNHVLSKGNGMLGIWLISLCPVFSICMLLTSSFCSHLPQSLNSAPKIINLVDVLCHIMIFKRTLCCYPYSVTDETQITNFLVSGISKHKFFFGLSSHFCNNF